MGTAIDQTTGLPEGFVLDAPPVQDVQQVTQSAPVPDDQAGTLPAGFVVDELPEGFTLDEPEQEPTDQEQGFLGRVGEDLSARVASSKESINRDRTLLTSLPIARNTIRAFEVLGDAAGAGLDVVGEAATSAIGAVGDLAQTVAPGISATVSDFVSQKSEEFTDFAAEKINAIAATDIGKAGIEAAQNSAEAWQDFSKANPTIAAEITDVMGAAGNIGLAFAPVKGVKATKSKAAVKPGLLSRGAAALDKSVVAKQKDFIDDLVKPLATKKVREAEIKRTIEGGGLLGSRTITPSAGETAIAKTVSGIEGVKQSNTLLQNLNAVRGGLTREADNLTALLKDNKVKIPRLEIKNKMNGVLNTLSENPLIVGDAAKTGERIVSKARSILKSNPNTPAGIMKSRKAFDKWVERQRPKVFDPATESALSLSVRETRQAMNGIVQKSVPNVDVKDSLAAQSNLFRAMDNIGPKAAKEANTALGRLVGNVSTSLGVKSILDPKMTLALSALGFGALASPGATAALGGAALAVKGAQSAVTSNAAKRAVSKVLRLSDKAIKKATLKGSVDLAKKLRADRAIIIEWVKSIEGEQK